MGMPGSHSKPSLGKHVIAVRHKVGFTSQASEAFPNLVLYTGGDNSQGRKTTEMKD